MSETVAVVIGVGVAFGVLLLFVRAQLLSRIAADLAGLSEKTAGYQASTASDLAHLTAGLARSSDLIAIQERTTHLSHELARIAAGVATTADLAVIQERTLNLSQELTRMDARATQLMQESLLFREGLDATVATLKRVAAEERDAFERRMRTLFDEEIVSRASRHIELHAVPRGEFDRLRTRVDRLIGAEELAERVDLARALFDSSDLRVMTWQCKVIRMLDGGLAPEAEEDTMAAAGIPLTAARAFLKKLQDMEVITCKKVTSYWMAPDYQWLLVAAEDPTTIRSKIDAFTRNEAEYQAHVVAHLSDVEPGLLLVAEQWEVPTGKIDIKARDASGTDVFIELKYPSACSSAYAQLLKYRQDITSQAGAHASRFVLVAPKIPQRTLDLLARDQLEAKEIQY